MEANLFFRLVSTRYERGSILLTSNKHARDWPDIFAGDEILTAAILDRLLHQVAVIHIDRQSYRLRELGALLSPTREGPRADSPRSTQPPATAGICVFIRCGSLGVLAQPCMPTSCPARGRKRCCAFMCTTCRCW
ncbi:ATP-binding protein [Gemmatimonas sp.]|uniref:ATP-binding protein n=1 Tax=Gemmatimonas sp. TaxID=1962908 RepID=UPI0031F4230C